MSDMQNDPFKIMGIPYWATDEEIKAAFQKKLKEVGDPGEILTAYGSLRDAAERSKVEWGTLSYCSATPSKGQECSTIEIEDLIRELAFCSPWELGDDSCLNM